MSDSSVEGLENMKTIKDPQTDRSAVMKWTAKDTGWMLNLFGTAIGAGVLYLPITAGAGGIWPPTSHCCARRFVMLGHATVASTGPHARISTLGSNALPGM